MAERGGGYEVTNVTGFALISYLGLSTMAFPLTKHLMGFMFRQNYFWEVQN